MNDKKIIVALDSNNFHDLKNIVDEIKSHVFAFKIFFRKRSIILSISLKLKVVYIFCIFCTKSDLNINQVFFYLEHCPKYHLKRPQSHLIHICEEPFVLHQFQYL